MQQLSQGISCGVPWGSSVGDMECCWQSHGCWKGRATSRSPTNAPAGAEDLQIFFLHGFVLLVARGWLCVTVFTRQQQTGREAHPARSSATAAGVTPAEPGAFIPNISAHLKSSPECFPLATGILGGRSSAARVRWADSCPPDRSRNEGRCCQLLACLGPCPAPTPGWGLLSFLSILSQCVFRLFILQKTD